MENKQRNLRNCSAFGEPQRGIVITTPQRNAVPETERTELKSTGLKRCPLSLTLKEMVDEGLALLGRQLRILQIPEPVEEENQVRLRVPRKIGEADPKPKGKIRLRRVLEY